MLEILYGENLCFIEWPEKIHNFLPNNYVRINIEINNKLRKLLLRDMDLSGDALKSLAFQASLSPKEEMLEIAKKYQGLYIGIPKETELQE